VSRVTLSFTYRIKIFKGLYVKSHVYEYSSQAQGTVPQWNSMVFMSNNIQPIISMEGWSHGAYRVQTWRYIIHPHTAYWVLIILGCLVCVILVAVVCDKPAAHKIGSFASHSHNHFCTLCWISAHDKAKVVAFQDGGKSHGPYVLCWIWCYVIYLPACCSISLPDHQGASSTGNDYHQLSTPTTCKNFVKEHMTHYSELLRLPYFNMVEQIIINPIYNLFLGMPCP